MPGRQQPFRHDIHPDTLKQTPTTPGRNKSGEKSYWGGPSWWAWFWQLARLLKTELLLLVIIRHLHLRPSRSSVS